MVLGSVQRGACVFLKKGGGIGGEGKERMKGIGVEEKGTNYKQRKEQNTL